MTLEIISAIFFMSQKFSQELQEEMIWYFEKYHNLSISNETADEFLDSLGELFLWFNKSEEERTRPSGRGRTPR